MSLAPGMGMGPHQGNGFPFAPSHQSNSSMNLPHLSPFGTGAPSSMTSSLQLQNGVEGSPPPFGTAPSYGLPAGRSPLPPSSLRSVSETEDEYEEEEEEANSSNRIPPPFSSTLISSPYSPSSSALNTAVPKEVGTTGNDKPDFALGFGLDQESEYGDDDEADHEFGMKKGKVHSFGQHGDADELFLPEFGGKASPREQAISAAATNEANSDLDASGSEDDEDRKTVPSHSRHPSAQQQGGAARLPRAMSFALNAALNQPAPRSRHYADLSTATVTAAPISPKENVADNDDDVDAEDSFESLPQEPVAPLSEVNDQLAEEDLDSQEREQRRRELSTFTQNSFVTNPTTNDDYADAEGGDDLDKENVPPHLQPIRTPSLVLPSLPVHHGDLGSEVAMGLSSGGPDGSVGWPHSPAGESAFDSQMGLSPDPRRDGDYGLGPAGRSARVVSNGGTDADTWTNPSQSNMGSVRRPLAETGVRGAVGDVWTGSEMEGEGEGDVTADFVDAHDEEQEDDMSDNEVSLFDCQVFIQAFFSYSS